MSAKDIRFTCKGNVLYVSLLGVPETDITVKSLAKGGLLKGKIRKIELLGSEERIKWRQSSDGLHIVRPATVPCNEAIVFKVIGSK
jgi:alpha-L-fucosidase